MGTELASVSTGDAAPLKIYPSPCSIQDESRKLKDFRERQGVFLSHQHLALGAWVYFISLALGSFHHPILIYLITNYIDSDIKSIY